MRASSPGSARCRPLTVRVCALDHPGGLQNHSRLRTPPPPLSHAHTPNQHHAASINSLNRGNFTPRSNPSPAPTDHSLSGEPPAGGVQEPAHAQDNWLLNSNIPLETRCGAGGRAGAEATTGGQRAAQWLEGWPGGDLTALVRPFCVSTTYPGLGSWDQVHSLGMRLPGCQREGSWDGSRAERTLAFHRTAPRSRASLLCTKKRYGLDQAAEPLCASLSLSTQWSAAGWRGLA